MRAARESKNGYVPLPAAFVERVGREVPGLVEALDGTEPPVSVRFNPAKPYTMPADDTDGQVAWAEVGETAYLARRGLLRAGGGVDVRGVAVATVSRRRTAGG